MIEKCERIESELNSFWPEWQVVECFEGGACGDLFRIRKDSFGIRVESSLKVIRCDESVDPSAIPETFLKEIQIIEALRGTPNVVIVEDYYCKREGMVCSLFVRMELLTNFRKVLIRYEENPSLLSIKEVLKFGKDISTALVYFEKKGIRHRNIKPDNIFVDEFGNYKVGNSGVLRRMGTAQSASAKAGIEAFTYMPPEVYNGQGYNNTVDTYALGLILYQLLNKGRIPFLQ